MIEMKDLRVGQKALLKTRQQLLACGYTYEYGMLSKPHRYTILSSMENFLGNIVTIGYKDSDRCVFLIKEDTLNYNWSLDTIAQLITEEENKCHISIDEILNKFFKLEEQNENK